MHFFDQKTLVLSFLEESYFIIKYEDQNRHFTPNFSKELLGKILKRHSESVLKVNQLIRMMKTDTGVKAEKL